MNQDLALKILLSGENVLLTGPAGTGKTYVLNEFVSQSKKAGKSVAVTATTGLAATHLGGNTIHAFSGIGIHDYLPKDFFDKMHKGRRDAIIKADVLIIDEISMLHDFRLDLVDKVLRTVRAKDAPFGGIQLVLCGDFFQLPPVTRSGESPSRFIVHSSSFLDLDPTICYLSDQYRQDDDQYLEILSSIRNGSMNQELVDLLHSRQNAKLEGDEITELFTTNVDVDTLNAKRLTELKGESAIFEATTTGKANYVETLKRSCLASPTLELKVGALVMCLKNSPEKKFVNGSLGVVEGFDKEDGFPIVKLNSGRKVTMTPDTWELVDGETKRASIEQIPLKLAWAITVHKSQGMTLDYARMDLRRTFVPGMGYVALSRVPNLEALSLKGLNKMALQVSEDAIEIDEKLQSKSKKDEQRFIDLAS